MLVKARCVVELRSVISSLNPPQPTPPWGNLEARLAAGGRENAGLGGRRGELEPRDAGAGRRPDSPCGTEETEAESGQALGVDRCPVVSRTIMNGSIALGLHYLYRGCLHLTRATIEVAIFDCCFFGMTGLLKTKTVGISFLAFATVWFCVPRP